MPTRILSSVLLLAALLLPAAAGAQPALRTRHVFLIIADGLRWQEVFTGADERLINADNGVDDPEALRSAYWRPTPEARREALMPFLWKTAVPQGQIYGNLLKSSDAHITNPWRVSYPGYSETFCGYPSDEIKNNAKIMNPETTVFEWLNNKPAFSGRVAAFGAWDTYPFIFNTDRSHLPVDSAVGPLDFGRTSPVIDLWNTARAETPYRWGSTCFDSMVFRPALEWIRLNSPRLVFLGLGETDEWAHEGNYDQYLHAARRVDTYLAALWNFIQSSPEYKDSTSIILLCDHGRGGDAPLTTPPAALPALDGVQPQQWRDHGGRIAGAQQIWIAIWGPDTPPLRERADLPAVTQSQVAATLAALLGEDYPAAQPRAAQPIGDAIKAPADATRTP